MRTSFFPFGQSATVVVDFAVDVVVVIDVVDVVDVVVVFMTLMLSSRCCFLSYHRFIFPVTKKGKMQQWLFKSPL